MSDIKPGDLVMVVKPQRCCGGVALLGKVFVVQKIDSKKLHCISCNHLHAAEMIAIDQEGFGYFPQRLKKIDPPSEGDSLPTRKELDKPVEIEE